MSDDKKDPKLQKVEDDFKAFREEIRAGLTNLHVHCSTLLVRPGDPVASTAVAQQVEQMLSGFPAEQAEAPVDGPQAVVSEVAPGPGVVPPATPTGEPVSAIRNAEDIPNPAVVSNADDPKSVDGTSSADPSPVAPRPDDPAAAVPSDDVKPDSKKKDAPAKPARARS